MSLYFLSPFARASKRLLSGSATAAAIFALSIGAGNTAFGQVTTDVFDQSQGGSITSSSSTLSGFEAVGIIGGATSGEGGAGRTIFNQIGPNLVNFSTSSIVTVDGVNLFTLADLTPAGTLSRETFSFSFFADTDNNGSFETTLISGVNPVDTGIANTYTFAAVTAQSFQASFTGNPAAQFTGPRIVELDALQAPNAIPEPSEWMAMAMAATSVGGLMLRARRRRIGKSGTSSAAV